MRLDKYLSDMQIGSRKEVKGFIKRGLVTVNGTVIKSDKYQVNEKTDEVIFDGDVIRYQKEFYYLLNKPQGVISATIDDYEETVLDLFSDEDYRDDLFPVGRLDKDTEGLLVITNDGALSHRLLSPKRHVPKEYYVQVNGCLSKEDQEKMAIGLKIDGDEICLPALLTILTVDESKQRSTAKLVLHEGKFHQVKRMMQACGKTVTYLQRIRMGGLTLPEDLALGKYRALSAEELELLQQK